MRTLTYSDTKRPAAGTAVALNDVNSNEIKISMKTRSDTKPGGCSHINDSDMIIIQVINKTHKELSRNAALNSTHLHITTEFK